MRVVVNRLGGENKLMLDEKLDIGRLSAEEREKVRWENIRCQA